MVGWLRLLGLLTTEEDLPTESHTTCESVPAVAGKSNLPPTGCTHVPAPIVQPKCMPYHVTPCHACAECVRERNECVSNSRIGP